MMQHRVDDWWHSGEIQCKKPVDRWDKVIIVNWILKQASYQQFLNILNILYREMPVIDESEKESLQSV
jgi:hypothetical protein